MVALESPQALTGIKAPDFNLMGVDDRSHSLTSLKGARGTVIMFICNHCPYVLKQLDRMIALNHSLAALGVALIAINPNDATTYPEDSFENMKLIAKQKAFPFPYLLDSAQEVARAYGAVCTPDIYGYNAKLELQYRGRLDQSWSAMINNPKQELLEAMKQIAETGSTSLPQNPSIGCSIKWKRADRAAS